jgi:hypothetical protein
MTSKRPKSRTEDLVVQEADGEKLIYDLRSNKAFCLNATAALVWEACDGTRDVNDIGNHLSSKLRSKANDDLVWLALDQLKKENLLEEESAVENRFQGVSRRDVIRKIGLGSMIALPIVASIVAPRAVQAQTCVQTSTTCTGNNRSAGCNCSSTANCAAGLTCSPVSGGTCC